MDERDVLALRRDFPILGREVNGHPLTYLDSAASSQRPRQVVAAMQEYYERHHANVHRGAHTLATEATDAFERARERVARFIGAPESRSLVFTRNTTEAINLVAASWGRTNLGPGDEVVLSVAEHHANLVPWHFLKRERGIVIRPVPLTGEQRLDLDAMRSVIGPRTKLVSTFHMSNVLGAVNPVAEIARLAHAAGALLLVDGAQGAPHLEVDVRALGCDFYAFSGHKMLGPTGIGGLWARAEVLEAMPPFLGGGEMIRRVTLEDSTYADIPARFEAGTPSVAEAVGLAAAVDYLGAVGMAEVARHDHELAGYALDLLDGVPGLTLFGPRGDDRGGIVTFDVAGLHAHDVATILDLEGIAVRAGHHCAQPLGAVLGVAATARASFYLYTTRAEVERFALALRRLVERFGAHGPRGRAARGLTTAHTHAAPRREEA
ncbi:MAG: cysteine desulfurase [Trueperaceae bacterium]|nr:cysteine desulfurase [Trueperaceae bacterium]